MFLEEIFEVTIGLIFIWLLISLAAMGFQEWISSVLQWREKYLQKAIRQMLNTDKYDLAARFYNHPLIISLQPSISTKKKVPQLPSYIPPGVFASALFDIIIRIGIEESPVLAWNKSIASQIEVINDPVVQKSADEDWKLILETAEHVTSSGASLASIDTLKTQLDAYGARYPEAQPTINIIINQVSKYYREFLEEENASLMGTEVSDLAMRQFRLGVKAIGSTQPKLRKTLLALLQIPEEKKQSGDEVIVQTHQKLENWFSDAMNQLTIQYKKLSRSTAFVCGLTLAILFNIDSINTATILWREPALRQSIAAYASSSYVSDPITLENDTNTTNEQSGSIIKSLEMLHQLSILNLPIGWISEPLTTDVQCDIRAETTHDSSGTFIHIQGVRFGDACYPMINSSPVNINYFLSILRKLIGMLITAVAASQGAPFWFDILKKLVNIRNSQNTSISG